MHAIAATGGLIRLSPYGSDVMPILQQTRERGHCCFRRTHENDPHDDWFTCEERGRARLPNPELLMACRLLRNRKAFKPQETNKSESLKGLGRWACPRPS